MSSWLPSAVGRISLLLAVLTPACDRGPTGSPPLASVSKPVVPEPAPAPVVVPWFQGQWLGGLTVGDGLQQTPITATLAIDASGRALGSSSLKLELRGVVEGESVRLEASGEGGHGVVVLHKQTGVLAGVLHYAAAGADHGKSALLTLTRAELP